MAEFNRVHAWLKRQYKIDSPRDWLEACVEWVKEENPGRTVAYKDLCSSVVEQWRLSDLPEIGARCLPPDCVKLEKTTLPGSYCLQVNSIIDVGSSYYGQIQKVKGTANENVLVSATQLSQTQEPKAGRMLMLTMTDGVQIIKGMEYQPLPGFDPNMSAGVKVVIQGPVLCRRGVIMLTKTNITVLGGEVESLVEANAQLNVLQRTLTHQCEQGRRPLPKAKLEPKPSVKPSASSRSTSRQTQPQPVPGNRWSNQSQRSQEFKTNSDFPDDFPDPDQLAALDDHWTDDIDMDMMVDDIEIPEDTKPRQMLPPAQKTGHQQSFSRKNPSRNQQPLAMKNSSRSKLSTSKQACSRPTPSTNKQDFSRPNPPTNKQAFSKLTTSISQQSIPRQAPDQRCSSELKPSSSVGIIQPLSHVDRSNSRSDYPKTVQSRPNTRPIISRTGEVKVEPIVIKPEPQNSTHFHVDGFDDDLDDTDLIMCDLDNVVGNTIAKPEAPITRPKQITPRPPAKRSRRQESDLMGSRWPQDAMSSFFEDDDDDDFMSCAMPDVHKEIPKIGLHTPPYSYISVLLEHWPFKNKQTIKIKAFISTLLSRLEHNEGRSWSLRVKINDGSAAMDVDLQDKMLTSLIGYTAQQCRSMKAEAKVNKEVRTRLVTAINQCQQRLVQMSCIMDVEVGPGLARPCISGYHSLTQNDVLALQQRNNNK